MRGEGLLGKFLTRCGVSFLCLFMVSGIGIAGECFIKKDCFSVKEPVLFTRACHLYFYSKNVTDPPEMAVATKDVVHPDPLKAEFIKLVVEKKMYSLMKETPVFDCAYSLENLTKDPEWARIQGSKLPEFSCAGVKSYLVPVRPVRFSECQWVALEDIDCK